MVIGEKYLKDATDPHRISVNICAICENKKAE
jgi:hypothetical protein